MTKVHYRDPGGTPRSVEGRVIVVACSAIESVRLLMLSGEIDAAFQARINPHGLLGAYFLTHCFGGAEAIMPGRYDKSISLDSDWATDYCASTTSSAATACGRAARSTTTRRTRRCPSRWLAPIAARIWTPLESFVEDTGMTGSHAGLVGREFRHAALRELHGQPGAVCAQPYRTAPHGARQVGTQGGLHHQGLASATTVT